MREGERRVTRGRREGGYKYTREGKRQREGQEGKGRIVRRRKKGNLREG